MRLNGYIYIEGFDDVQAEMLDHIAPSSVMFTDHHVGPFDDYENEFKEGNIDTIVTMGTMDVDYIEDLNNNYGIIVYDRLSEMEYNYVYQMSIIIQKTITRHRRGDEDD